MEEKIPNIEQKLTPMTEKEELQEKIAQVPEKQKEILRAHLEQSPERVYDPSYLISPEQRELMAKKLADPHFEEKQETIGYLLGMIEEKGILPVIAEVKKLNPSLADQFHDILIQYLNPPIK